MAGQRVLFVQPVLSPYSIPRYKELAALGDLDVHVALEADRFAERPEWRAKAIRGCSVAVLKGFGYRKRYRDEKGGYTRSYTKRVPLGLITHVRRLKPDLVVVCNPTQCVLARLARAGQRFAIGLVLEDTPGSDRGKPRWVRALRRWAYRGADLAFCFSGDALTYARSIGLTATLYRSAWSVSSVCGTPLRPARPSLGLRFVCVGELSSHKGIMHLLSAWKTFSQRHADVELELVGEGELRQAVEAFVRKESLESVTLAGHLPYEEVAGRYQAAQVFVLPTLGDLFSLVVTEAMSHGLPVLTTVYNGARELVREGENGYVFDPLVEGETLATLERVYADRPRLGEMGRASRQIIADYSHAKVMQRMNTDLKAFFEQTRISR